MTSLPGEIDVLVVGAGLFGSIIGKYLQRQGRQVTIVDAGLTMSGSAPAACLMRKSWLSKMTKDQQAQSFAVLDSLYGCHEIEAYIGVAGLGKRTTVFWVAPSGVLKPDRYIKQRVTTVHHDGGCPWFMVEGDVERHYAQLIIVAAGVWSNQLGAFAPGLSQQAGVAFTWPCDEVQESRATIEPWAPYKQLIRLPNRYPGELWTSDGTAVKVMDGDRTRKCLERCARFVNRNPVDAQVIIGLRPYIRGLKGPAYVEQVLPKVWVATGGAKNGTAGAGWAAYKLAGATN